MTGPAAPEGRLARVLGWVPRALAGKPHILALIALGVYLIVLPLAGFGVSARSELIGGNYLNATSDIGACIAAGGTVTLVHHQRKRHQALTAEIASLHRKIDRLASGESGERLHGGGDL